MYTNLSIHDFLDKLKNKDFFLLDVRPFSISNIEGTDETIAFNKIQQFTNLLPEDKSKPIVVYCNSGSTSQIASQILSKMGYTNVMNLEGGIMAYFEATKK